MVYSKLRHGLFMVLLLGALDGQGQTFSEWFRQKKTQQLYLLEQLAALKMYAGVAKKGYDIAKSGLQLVGDISNGEFRLHDLFITGLKKVNPSIRGSAKVAAIIQMQIGIGKAFGGILNNAELSLSNQLYISQVRENLWEECLKDLEELFLVTTSGKVEMDDQQRLERLDKVYLSIAEKSAFAQHFCNTVKLFISQKQQENRSIEETLKMYEINE